LCRTRPARAAALRAQLGIGRFVALGHSVGGGMALGCAHAWPDDCEALVLESAQAFVEPLTLAGIRAAEAQFAAVGPDGASPAMARLAAHHGDKAPWVLRAWVDTWLSPAFAGWNLDALLPGLRCPLLVLHGEQDEYGSPAQPQRFMALAGGPATLALLPGCGHVPTASTRSGCWTRWRAFWPGGRRPEPGAVQAPPCTTVSSSRQSLRAVTAWGSPPGTTTSWPASRLHSRAGWRHPPRRAGTAR
jgi:pimeloyl-ACP methyl ester carboxylesterase